MTPPRRGLWRQPQNCSGGIYSAPTDEPLYCCCRKTARRGQDPSLQYHPKRGFFNKLFVPARRAHLIYYLLSIIFYLQKSPPPGGQRTEKTYQFLRVLISLTTISTKASCSIVVVSPLRSRTLRLPASASLAPRTSIYGTRSTCCASRIL